MPLRQNLIDGEILGALWRHGMKLQSMPIVASADLALEAGLPPILNIDPDGGNTVLLPPEASCVNQLHIVRNTGGAAGEVLVLEEDSSTTVIATLGVGEVAYLWCDGTTWREVPIGTNIGRLRGTRAVAPTDDGLTTGIILSTDTHITCTSGNAAHWITLPALSASLIGLEIKGVIGATACEVRTPASGGNTINGGDASGGNESVWAASSFARFVAVSATGWSMITQVGATIAAPVPD